jgi:hypothetical protein
MEWFILVHIFTTWMSILSIGRLTEQEKELEILVLRHQLAILQRECDKPVIPNRIEKMTLAVLTTRLKQITHKTTSQLSNILRVFQPETVMGWHRKLVRRKWAHLHHSHAGRPRIDMELENLIIRFAQENPRWGYG